MVDGIGLMSSSVQTEAVMVPASDYEQLNAELGASVEQAQTAEQARDQAEAAYDSLVAAIMRGQHVQMDQMRYYVFCEGFARDCDQPRGGVARSDAGGATFWG